MYSKNIKLTEDDLGQIVEDVLQEINPNFFKPLKCEPLSHDYLIKRHEGLPKEYFNTTNIPYNPNEIVLYTSPKENSLEEGLIKTYPTSKAIDYVCKELNEKGYPVTPQYFYTAIPNDDNTIYGKIVFMIPFDYLNKEIDDILKQCFNLCGYYLAAFLNRRDNLGNPCIVYQFESRYQINKDDSIHSQYLFHATTANAAKKILRQGFCPSNRNTKFFKYEGRCYFFTIYNKQLFANFLEESNKKNKINSKSFNKDFKVITIDRKKCGDVAFFADPDFDGDIAVYTYENIPPSAILKCEDL